MHSPRSASAAARDHGSRRPATACCRSITAIPENGHRRAISLSEAHLQAARRDARHTLGREAEGVLRSLCSIGHRGACERKGRHSASWPRATATSTRHSLPRWAARRRRGRRRRPGHRAHSRGAVLREGAALPRLSESGRGRACRTLLADGSSGHRAPARLATCPPSSITSWARCRLLFRRLEPEAVEAPATSS
jgi:hypothetical protein